MTTTSFSLLEFHFFVNTQNKTFSGELPKESASHSREERPCGRADPEQVTYTDCRGPSPVESPPNALTYTAHLLNSYSIESAIGVCYHLLLTE